MPSSRARLIERSVMRQEIGERIATFLITLVWYIPPSMGNWAGSSLTQPLGAATNRTDDPPHPWLGLLVPDTK